MAKQRKNGPITQEERDFIKLNMSSMTANDIAEELGRNPNTISSLISQIDSTFNKEQILSLKKREDWSLIKQQFSDDEIALFEWHWNELVKQFKEEIYHTEGLQILNAIRSEILGSRALKDQRRIQLKIGELEKEIQDENNKGNPDKAKISKCESTIIQLSMAVEANAREYRECSKELKDALTKLKSTREQRLKRFEDSKKSFTQWMSNLVADKETQKNLGRYAEKMRLATYGEFVRLGTPHKYMNGEIDRPYLCKETLELDLEKGNRNEQ